MRFLPDRSRSCLSLCVMSRIPILFLDLYIYVITISLLLCSLLVPTSFVRLIRTSQFALDLQGKSPFKMTLTDAMKKGLIDAAVQGGCGALSLGFDS